MSTLTTEAASSTANHRSVARIIFGTLSLLVALALFGSAIAGIFGLETNRDASGYFVTHTHHYQTSSYALSTESLNVSGAAGALESGLLRIRITATSADAVKPLFIGIARTADVNRYLAGVAHEELRDFSFDPFKVSYQPLGHGSPKTLPASQPFGQTQASGTGTQLVSWPVKGGRWSAVVMNADGSRNLSVNAQLAAHLSGAWWWVVGMLAIGALALVGGITLIRSGSHKRPRTTATDEEV